MPENTQSQECGNRHHGWVEITGNENSCNQEYYCIYCGTIRIGDDIDHTNDDTMPIEIEDIEITDDMPDKPIGSPVHAIQSAMLTVAVGANPDVFFADNAKTPVAISIDDWLNPPHAIDARLELVMRALQNVNDSLARARLALSCLLTAAQSFAKPVDGVNGEIFTHQLLMADEFLANARHMPLDLRGHKHEKG